MIQLQNISKKLQIVNY